jgi:hypothetical protein
VEQCFELRECNRVRPFVKAGKPVFEVEYSLPPARFCAQARRLGISAISAGSDLDGATRPCD